MSKEMNPVVAAARRVAHVVWYRLARAAMERPDACRLFGLDLVILPGVLHPRLFQSSRVLAEHVMSLDLRDRTVADIGTGSGIQALLAARAGAMVTAIDINPAAIECATSNRGRNHLDGRVTLACSDLFEQVPAGQRFDLLITNPPFYSRAAVNERDLAFAAGDGNAFFRRLADSLPARLARRGTLLMIHSSDADFAPIARMLEEKGLTGRVVREKRGVFETLTVREFKAGS